MTDLNSPVAGSGAMTGSAAESATATLAAAPPERKKVILSRVSSSDMLVHPTPLASWESPATQPTARSAAACKPGRSLTVETDRVESKRTGEGQKQINQYILYREELGRGSYGLVRKGFNTLDGKFYAIKILNKNLLQKRKIMGRGRAFADLWEKVKVEIAIMKRLRHPNVVRLYEVIDDPTRDKLYMVLEYASKGALSDGSDVCTPFPEEEARAHFRDTIQGLEYLHSYNIAHRDIKPENLLLCEDGRIMIGDFGVSALFEHGDDRVRDTAGSAAFMAPEMLQAEAPFSARRTDVWSCGVTLYQLVFGRLPYTAANIHLLHDVIVSQPLEIPPGTDPQLADLLQRLLQVDPEKRITIPQIKEHPWVTRGGAWPMPSLSASLDGEGEGEAGSAAVDVLGEVSEKERSAAITLARVVMIVKLKGKMRKHAMRSRAARAASDATLYTPAPVPGAGPAPEPDG